MIKRMNKATSLLIAAAAVISLIPATGASAADRLETKDGTIEKAIAFDGGKYLFEGYKDDNSDNGLYYNSGKEDKLLEDIQDANIKGEYADKYASVEDSDEYLVDLSNGNVIDDRTAGDDADTVATKLRTALKKTDRYGAISSVNLDESSILKGNKFGETWYSYSATPATGADGENNTVGTSLYGFTNGDGKYIDASNVANIYVYSAEKNKMVKISEFSNKGTDVDDNGLLATLTAAPKVLTQDKDYIYTLVTVNVEDKGADAIVSGTTTDAAAKVDGAKVTERTFIQKISKAQGEKVDGAYVPKSVEAYELLSADDQLDSDDAKNATVAITNALESGKVTVVGNQLLAIETTSDNVKVTSIDLKKEKLNYKKESAQLAIESNKVDAYVAEKNDSDDIDVKSNVSESYDVDVNGNVWVVADGKISKFENNEFKTVYSVDSSLNAINVYDQDDLIVWKADGDIYTTVGGKTTTPPDQTPVTAGWVKNADGTWSFNKADGTKATGWVQDGAWYYINANGIMATGWVNDNGTWYFLTGSGAMKTGWVKDGANWYYLKASGAMATGWVNDNGTWYYLNGSGAMATGWVNDNGTWYYLNASGAMLANTTVDGYKLGASGAWIR